MADAYNREERWRDVDTGYNGGREQAHMKEILYFLLERGNSPLTTEVVLLVIV